MTKSKVETDLYPCESYDYTEEIQILGRLLYSRKVNYKNNR